MKILSFYYKNRVLSLLFIFFLFYLPAVQAQDQDEVESFFWGEDDKYKDMFEIDESLENESAVVLGREIYYNYSNKGKKYVVIEGKRDRIKILDKVSLDYYSEFSFLENFRTVRPEWGIRTKKSKMYFGAKIIKPNQEEQIIDKSEAVSIDDEENGARKIALPNLEIGDIIDFYYYTIEPFVNASKDGYVFEPVIDLVSSEYHIQNLDIELYSDDDFTVNFDTFNGAPNITKDNIHTRQQKGNIYYFSDQNIEKLEYNRWINDYLELPTLKFQVIHSPGSYNNKRPDGFATEISTINSSIEDDELAYFINYFFGYIDSGIDAKEEKLFRKLGVHNDKKAFLYGYFHSQRFYNNLSTRGMSLDLGRAGQLADFLDEWEYDYNLYIAPHHEYATKESVVFPHEITYLFEINGLDEENDEPLYLTSFDFTIRPGDLPLYLQGQDCWKYNSGVLKDAKLPESVAKDNFEATDLLVTLTDDLSSAEIKGKRTFGGTQKYRNLTNWLNFTDFLEVEKENKDHSTYEGKRFEENWYDNSMPLLESLETDIDKEEFYEETKDELIIDLGYEFQTDLEAEETDFKFKILERGLSAYANEKNLITAFSFNTPDHINKAGNNYIIKAGQFIGQQVALEEDEIAERNHDIYVESAKEFRNTIEIRIPDGYTVKGVEDLNLSIDNSSGRFISTAELKGNSVFLTTVKTYKKKNVDKENWNEMVDFLEAAYEFTQKKLLITKE